MADQEYDSVRGGGWVDLTLPRFYLDRMLAQFLQQAHNRDGGWFTSSIGLCEHAGGMEILVQGMPSRFREEEKEREGSVSVIFCADPAARLEDRFRQFAAEEGVWRAVLALSHSEESRIVIGAVRTPAGTVLPIRRLQLPGNRMFTLNLTNEISLDQAGGWREAPDRWSRSQGVLRAENWLRYTAATYAIIGSGRLGSMLAHRLSRDGVEQITLIDPKDVQLNTLGEGDIFSEKDIGKNKAIALAERLQTQYGWLRARGTPVPASRWAALSAIKSADVIINASDTDGGRYLGAVATFYHRLLLDVGARISRSQDGRLLYGLELRVVHPGETCLDCLGGVEDREAALEQWHSREAEERALHPNWTDLRAGSLASWNMVAAGMALTELAEVMTGESSSRWVRMTRVEGELLQLETRQPQRRTRECWCAHQGIGDAGWKYLFE